MNKRPAYHKLPSRLQAVKDNPALWSRFVETAIGAHLVTGIKERNGDLYYRAGKQIKT
ncbi:MAG: hypothetical protein JW904_01285 [Spirochaetales bacterium]|nr:hypothetical protein [Spirochaetales bacterium]